MLKRASLEKKRVKRFIKKRNRAELKCIALEISSAAKEGYRSVYWFGSIRRKNIATLRKFGYSIRKQNLYNYIITW